MARISYTTYSFTPPPLLEEQEFNRLKFRLKESPSISPFPSSDFIQEFKGVLKTAGISLLAIIIGSIFKELEFIAALGFFILFAIAFFGPSYSIISYLWFTGKRSMYFSKLQNDIVNSPGYTQFVSVRSR